MIKYLLGQAIAGAVAGAGVAIAQEAVTVENGVRKMDKKKNAIGMGLVGVGLVVTLVNAATHFGKSE